MVIDNGFPPLQVVEVEEEKAETGDVRLARGRRVPTHLQIGLSLVSVVSPNEMMAPFAGTGRYPHHLSAEDEQKVALLDTVISIRDGVSHAAV